MISHSKKHKKSKRKQHHRHHSSKSHLKNSNDEDFRALPRSISRESGEDEMLSHGRFDEPDYDDEVVPSKRARGMSNSRHRKVRFNGRPYLYDNIMFFFVFY